MFVYTVVLYIGSKGLSFAFCGEIFTFFFGGGGLKSRDLTGQPGFRTKHDSLMPKWCSLNM
jgi:hypothetical protein